MYSIKVLFIGIKRIKKQYLKRRNSADLNFANEQGLKRVMNRNRRKNQKTQKKSRTLFFKCFTPRVQVPWTECRKS